MRDTTQLHPELQAVIPKFLSKCKAQGLIVSIGECFRSVAEQDALYAKGRTASGSIVTNCKGSSYSSPHQWGVAFDFIRNDGKGAYNDNDGFFAKVGSVGISLGLEWGGNWTSFKDKPHLQLPKYLPNSTTTRLKKVYGTPDKFIKTWGKATVSNTESEELTLTQYEELKNLITQNQEKIYHYTSELPEYAKEAIQFLLNKGYYTGASDSDLNLPETLMRSLIINYRAGLYK